MNYYNEIKNELMNNEINRKVKNYSINRSDLNTYYNVGQMLSEAGKQYGESIIKNYSIKLVSEVDKKYNEINLKRMRQFYWKVEKGATLWTQLTWSHVRLLFNLDYDSINYYIRVIINKHISVRELEYKLKSNEYERLPFEARNKLINEENLEIIELVPNPILIKNNILIFN